MRLSSKRILVTALAAGSITLCSAGSAAAGLVTAASGSLTPTSVTFAPPRSVGSDTILQGTGTHAWTGTLRGTSTVAVAIVEHASGQAEYVGSGTFNGTTPCGAGTLRFVTWGNGPFPTFSGTVVLIGAAGHRPIQATLHLDLVLGPDGATGTYSGEVRCG